MGGKYSKAGCSLGDTKRLDRCLLLFWAGSLLFFCTYLHFVVQAYSLVLALAYVMCLPLIHPRTPLVLVLAIGCVNMGIATGMQLIDLCFDMSIIWGGDIHISAEVGSLSGPMVAWLYYKTIVASFPVNLGISVVLCFGLCGAAVGVTRSEHAARLKWLHIVVAVSIGIAAYVFFVVPRYASILASTSFSEDLFVGWHTVMSLRLLLFGSTGVATSLCSSMLLDACAKQSKSRLSSTTHLGGR